MIRDSETKALIKSSKVKRKLLPLLSGLSNKLVTVVEDKIQILTFRVDQILPSINLPLIIHKTILI